MVSYMASNGSCFMVTWTIFKIQLLEVGLTQTGRPWHSKISQLLLVYFDHVWGPCMNRNSLIQCLAEGPVTYDFTLHLVPHYMILEESWDGLWTLLLGPHNFMVTTLGSCVNFEVALARSACAQEPKPRLYLHAYTDHFNYTRNFKLCVFNTKERGNYVIVYKHISLPSNIKSWPPIGLLPSPLK